MTQAARSSLPPPSAWRSAAEAAAAYIATNALYLSCKLVPTGSPVEADGVDLVGALVPIVSDLEAVQVGLFSSEDGCAAMARALLQLGADEEVDGPSVADAISEIVNMLAGNVKGRVASYASGAALGLPTYIHGWLEAAPRQTIDKIPALVGNVDVLVVIVRGA